MVELCTRTINSDRCNEQEVEKPFPRRSHKMDAWDTEYLKIAVQYYVAARSATFAFFWPVAGNLFHHAVEMFLKFLLLKTYSEEELRDSFRHNLRRLWKEYKRVNSGDHLGKYDQLVSTINRMEDLRYPRSGYVFSIDLQAGPVHDASGQVAKRTQHYHLNLEDLDEFISTLLVGRVTSGWFRALLSHGDAQVQYEQHNVHRFY